VTKIDKCSSVPVFRPTSYIVTKIDKKCSSVPVLKLAKITTQITGPGAIFEIPVVHFRDKEVITP
jgi:hypothetical protein